MKKILALLLCIVFVSGCIGNDLKGDISVDEEGLTIDPDPVTIKKETVIDMVSDFIDSLLEVPEEAPVENESVAEQTAD